MILRIVGAAASIFMGRTPHEGARRGQSPPRALTAAGATLAPASASFSVPPRKETASWRSTSTIRDRHWDPIIAEELRHLRAHPRRIPRRPGRRGHVPRVSPQPRRIRATPGRARADAAGSRCRTGGSPPSSSRRRLHHRGLLAGMGSSHDPPERAVPLHPARADAGDPPADDVRRPRVTPRRAATPSATSSGSISPAPARRRSSTSRRGRRPHRLPAPPPLRSAPAPEVQDPLITSQEYNDEQQDTQIKVCSVARRSPTR